MYSRIIMGKKRSSIHFIGYPRFSLSVRYLKKLSCEAKLLYGLLLDRMQLSVKNRWLDSEGKVYIYFSQEQIAGLMGCGVKKVRCLLKELDDRKGIGLITRVRQGLGNPDRIYVKKMRIARTVKRKLPDRSKMAYQERHKCPIQTGVNCQVMI